MALMNTCSNSSIKYLTAEILPTGYAEFECGFVLPRKEIQFLTSAQVLQTGDKVSFEVRNVTVDKHTHRFECKCGAIHYE